jgi:23S rRNA (cytosine1962-C5)-methyltransferase
VWDLFTHLPPLLADCAKLLAPERAHLILTAYAIRASALALDGLMQQTLAGHGGLIESGELAISEQSGRLAIGTSLYSRWRSG